jgi:hypothetical protein
VLVYLGWIEQTAVSTWLRESTSLFVFPVILILHTLGMGLLAGINLVIDLRLLGAAPGLQIAPVRRFLPLMWAGFWVNLATGIALVTAYPTKAFTNPVFYVKMLLIALGLATVRAIGTRMFRDASAAERPVPGGVKVLAAGSLVFWAGAIVAGRLLPHTASRLMSNMP